MHLQISCWYFVTAVVGYGRCVTVITITNIRRIVLQRLPFVGISLMQAIGPESFLRCSVVEFEGHWHFEKGMLSCPADLPRRPTHSTRSWAYARRLPLWCSCARSVLPPRLLLRLIATHGSLSRTACFVFGKHRPHGWPCCPSVTLGVKCHLIPLLSPFDCGTPSAVRMIYTEQPKSASCKKYTPRFLWNKCAHDS